MTLDDFKNGSVHELPSLSYAATGPNSYSTVAISEHVAVKCPTSYGFSEYRKYIKSGRTDSDEIRSLEDLERYSNAERLLAIYPEFTKAWGLRPVEAHYLLVLRLQLDRLRQHAPIAVPDSRFVLCTRKALWFFRQWQSVVIQKRVRGTCLWDMLDMSVSVPASSRIPILPQYQHLLPTISTQMFRLLECDFSKHINWFVRNFVMEDSTNTLFYIDSKPPVIFGRWRNEHDMNRIRLDFAPDATLHPASRSGRQVAKH